MAGWRGLVGDRRRCGIGAASVGTPGARRQPSSAVVPKHPCPPLPIHPPFPPRLSLPLQPTPPRGCASCCSALSRRAEAHASPRQLSTCWAVSVAVRGRTQVGGWVGEGVAAGALLLRFRSAFLVARNRSARFTSQTCSFNCSCLAPPTPPPPCSAGSPWVDGRPARAVLPPLQQWQVSAGKPLLHV